MANLLVLIGIIFVALAFRKSRIQHAEEQKELQELKQVRDELAEARKEVGTLLEQLEVVSEKVVEDITSKVEEARTLQNENADMTEPAVAGGEGSEEPEPEDTGEPGDGSEDYDEACGHEDDYDDDDDVYDYENEDDEDDEDDNDGERRAVAPVEEKFRHSITVLRQNSRSREPARSKTIMFPRRKDCNSSDRQAAGQEEQSREVSPRTQMVYAMAKLGYSEEEIAKQLKMGKGEISLMLELKRKGEEANV